MRDDERMKASGRRAKGRRRVDRHRPHGKGRAGGGAERREPARRHALLDIEHELPPGAVRREVRRTELPIDRMPGIGELDETPRGNGEPRDLDARDDDQRIERELEGVVPRDEPARILHREVVHEMLVIGVARDEELVRPVREPRCREIGERERPRLLRVEASGADEIRSRTVPNPERERMRKPESVAALNPDRERPDALRGRLVQGEGERVLPHVVSLEKIEIERARHRVLHERRVLALPLHDPVGRYRDFGNARERYPGAHGRSRRSLLEPENVIVGVERVGITRLGVVLEAECIEVEAIRAFENALAPALALDDEDRHVDGAQETGRGRIVVMLPEGDLSRNEPRREPRGDERIGPHHVEPRLRYAEFEALSLERRPGGNARSGDGQPVRRRVRGIHEKTVVEAFPSAGEGLAHAFRRPRGPAPPLEAHRDGDAPRETRLAPLVDREGIDPNRKHSLAPHEGRLERGCERRRPALPPRIGRKIALARRKAILPLDETLAENAREREAPEALLLDHGDRNPRVSLRRYRHVKRPPRELHGPRRRKGPEPVDENTDRPVARRHDAGAGADDLERNEARARGNEAGAVRSRPGRNVSGPDNEPDDTCADRRASRLCDQTGFTSFPGARKGRARKRRGIANVLFFNLFLRARKDKPKMAPPGETRATARGLKRRWGPIGAPIDESKTHRVFAFRTGSLSRPSSTPPWRSRRPDRWRGGSGRSPDRSETRPRSCRAGSPRLPDAYL